MNILIEGENCENYIAKVHESYRTGLKSFFNVKFWGKGYENYQENISSFVEIEELLFGKDEADILLLTDCYTPNQWQHDLKYTDIQKLKCKKAIMLCDFWSEVKNFEEYEEFILRNGIDYIFSFFIYPLKMWKSQILKEKLYWFRPSFDPKIFNDWGKEKLWDVANLNAGIFKENSFYPERFEMHKILSTMKDIKYYTAEHPGWGFFSDKEALVGEKFSRVLNQSKIAICSGNLKYRNFAPKYIEIMASGTCLFAYEPMETEMVGLIDGENYVKITAENLEEKIRYYLCNKEELMRITKNGYKFVMNNYSSYTVALRLYNEILSKM